MANWDGRLRHNLLSTQPTHWPFYNSVLCVATRTPDQKEAEAKIFASRLEEAQSTREFRLVVWFLGNMEQKG